MLSRSLLRFKFASSAAAAGAALALAVLVPTTARAQVTITVTATATSSATGAGYTLGQSYTFAFTTGPSFSTTPVSYFVAGQNNWGEEEATDNQLFAAVSGTGLTGTFARPASFYGPYSYLWIRPANVSLFAGNDDSAAVGLFTPNATGIRAVHANGIILGDGPDFAFAQTHTQPNAYFSAYAGTYTATSGTVILHDQNFTIIGNFDATSVTISSASAIPEPSTYAALAGAAVLGLAVWRRQRRSLPAAPSPSPLG